jgi:hypothetical protein
VSSALTPIVGGVIGVVSKTADTVGGWLGGARTIAIEAAFISLAIGLLALGAWKIAAPKVDKLVEGIL